MLLLEMDSKLEDKGQEIKTRYSDSEWRLNSCSFRFFILSCVVMICYYLETVISVFGFYEFLLIVS